MNTRPIGLVDADGNTQMTVKLTSPLLSPSLKGETDHSTAIDSRRRVHRRCAGSVDLPHYSLSPSPRSKSDRTSKGVDGTYTSSVDGQEIVLNDDNDATLVVRNRRGKRNKHKTQQHTKDRSPLIINIHNYNASVAAGASDASVPFTDSLEPVLRMQESVSLHHTHPHEAAFRSCSVEDLVYAQKVRGSV